MVAWDATRARRRAAFLCCMLLSAAALPHAALANANTRFNRRNLRQTEEPSTNASPPLPKVALLFLTSEGRIHNEDVWANFLRLASGIAPANLPPVPGPPSNYVDLRALTGGELFPELKRAPHHQFSMSPLVGTHHHLERQPYSCFEPWAWERELVHLVSNGTCSAAGVADGCPGRATSGQDSSAESATTATPSSVIARQSLFSVYTHPPPGYDFPADSLFAGTEVSPRANTTRAYCQHRLVKGMLRLMEAALEDPWNEKFVMVSETSIPLYPPHVMWAQLMVEQLSRVNACPLRREDTWNLRRWHEDMETPFLKKEHFGKSQQWVVLSRELAALAVADRHVEVQFEAHCFTAQGENEEWRECISDEHFFPTLFAAYGVTHKTDCRGNAHYVDWNSSPEGGTHPTSFLPAMIVRDLVPTMRNIIWYQCDPQATLASAEALFQRLGRPAPQPEAVAEASLAYAAAISGGNGSAPRAAIKEWALGRGFVPLAPPCQLFARKFPAVSELGTAQMAVSCAGLGFGPWCMHNRRLWMAGSEATSGDSQGRFNTFT